MSTRIVRRRRQGLVSFGVFLWLAAAIAVVSYSSTPSILLPTTLAFGVILPTTTTKTRIHIGRKTPSSSVLHQSSTTTPTTTDKDEAAASHNKTKKKKISILLLPAQFCVPADYEILWKELATVMAEEDHDFILGTTLVAPLQRTDWIKVAKQVPTRAFWDATLPVHRTLEWYFDAMEQGIATILQKEGPNAHICLIGHSIGGWVGRAYLGGLSRSSSAISKTIRNNCSSLLTLGTPHSSPGSAWVDQTRGLLREIEASEACSPQALAASSSGLAMTCICSGDITGRLLTTNLEEVVAAASYLPLLGQLDTPGDGIVPLALSKLPSPAQTVIVKLMTKKDKNDKNNDTRIRHSHVLPTPWNLWNPSAPSIPFPAETYPSYVSSRPVIAQWSRYIQ